MNNKANLTAIAHDRTALVNRVADLETENARLREAVKAEREACAKIAENEFSGDGWHPAASNAGIGIASAIRSRFTKAV